MTYAIIPVNKLSKAKTRLIGTLAKEKRGELILHMLEDVLKALDETECQTIVISSDNLKDNIPRDIIFLDEGDRRMGLNRAVKYANQYAIKKGAKATLFIPADTPLIKKRHIEDILKLGEKHPLIISPARHGGTAILYRKPPDIIRERFTKTSYIDYQKEAEAKGLELKVYDSYCLSLDIDKEEDINEFMIHGKGTATYDYLKDMGW
ncbi:MAG: 2-phospho-L-lactate guanylyltransferase [Candidatus Hydrothermarchaeales archaeon]